MPFRGGSGICLGLVASILSGRMTPPDAFRVVATRSPPRHDLRTSLEHNAQLRTETLFCPPLRFWNSTRMSDVTCPSCGESFRFPDTPCPPGITARCPWCKETFSAGELLSRLAPLAELFSPEGERIDLEAPSPAHPGEGGGLEDDSMYETILATADEEPDLSSSSFFHSDSFETAEGELDDAGSSLPGRSDDNVIPQPVPVTGPVPPKPLYAVATGHSLPKTSIKTAPKALKRASPLRTVLGVVVGGLLAIPLAGGILTAIGQKPDWGFYPFNGSTSVKRGVVAASAVEPNGQLKGEGRQAPVDSDWRGGASGNLGRPDLGITYPSDAFGGSLPLDSDPPSLSEAGPDFAISDASSSGDDEPDTELPDSAFDSLINRDPGLPPVSRVPIESPDFDLPQGSQGDTDAAEIDTSEIAPVRPEMAWPEDSLIEEPMPDIKVQVDLPPVAEVGETPELPSSDLPSSETSDSSDVQTSESPDSGTQASLDPSLQQEMALPPPAELTAAIALVEESLRASRDPSVSRDPAVQRVALAKLYSAIAAVAAMDDLQRWDDTSGFVARLEQEDVLNSLVAFVAPKWLSFINRPNEGLAAVGELRRTESSWELIWAGDAPLRLVGEVGDDVEEGDSVVVLGRIVPGDVPSIEIGYLRPR